MSDTAQDHINLADTLNGQVIEPLKATERRHEEAKKKEMQYYQKLLSDRDRAYADRIKVGLIRSDSAPCPHAHFFSPQSKQKVHPPLTATIPSRADLTLVRRGMHGSRYLPSEAGKP